MPKLEGQHSSYSFHLLTTVEASWKNQYAYKQPHEEKHYFKEKYRFVMQQQELGFQTHNQQQDMLPIQEQHHKEMEEQRKYYEWLLETQKWHMRMQEKEKFDAKWKKYEEDMLGHQQN